MATAPPSRSAASLAARRSGASTPPPAPWVSTNRTAALPSQACPAPGTPMAGCCAAGPVSPTCAMPSLVAISTPRSVASRAAAQPAWLPAGRRGGPESDGALLAVCTVLALRVLLARCVVLARRECGHRGGAGPSRGRGRAGGGRRLDHEDHHDDERSRAGDDRGSQDKPWC